MIKKLFGLMMVFGLSLVGCTSSNNTLKIFSWQDYIDESVLDDFEAYYKETHGTKIKVKYETFATNESMYNTLTTGKSKYDLVCPSDYYIQKMILADDLIPFSRNLNGYSNVQNYNDYGSPFLKDLFLKQKVGTKSWFDYSIPYMWGTMGFLYNVDTVTNPEDLNSWTSLWNPAYKGRYTIKDSVRDVYFIGLVKLFEYELNDLAQRYAAGTITAQSYNESVQIYLNKTDNNTLPQVEELLKQLKANAYGLEVDEGKLDIVKGKIDINICWSGDAVYAIEQGKENGVNLSYVIPELGSNIWYDGWVMPKGAKTELAEEFINYVSRPEVAVANMTEVGYSSSVAGQEVFDLIGEWYDDSEGTIPVDLDWFFGDTITGNSIINVSEEGYGALIAQYPDTDTLPRLTIMEDFGSQNDKVLEMWSRVKAYQK
jgi:spermidine/putrescine transport system substrate-binding protein